MTDEEQLADVMREHNAVSLALEVLRLREAEESACRDGFAAGWAAAWLDANCGEHHSADRRAEMMRLFMDAWRKRRA